MRHALLFLSAGIIQDSQGNWISTQLENPLGKGFAPGGETRLWATKYLFDQKEFDYIMVPGGKGNDKNLADVVHPSIYTIVLQELIDMEIPEDKIIGEEQSNNTYEQLLYSIDLLKKNDVGSVTIISSDYHIPRIKAMITYKKELAFYNDIQTIFVLAEELCINMDPTRWKDHIEKVYASSWMNNLQKKEEQGIQQIKDGTYLFK
ncbi:YdcF family protein [Patescibacteria group bacterium]|nr:YdcF family protein [Patescibacteria group bacterium]MBU1722108.1 YdcF family protein [Patescibacteria group bacterium]MBU1901598.1 YdcF family protein [Patescibacteria group bacterium]